jgi:aminoglycoside phosphotransferase (APT) family kinase protein
MERRRGVVVRQREPLGLASRPDVRRRLSESLIDTLADLHALDVTEKPIAALGRPAGFVERQVRGWTTRWQGSKTKDLPEMDALSEWLIDRLPPDPAVPTVVHGDFKLDNVLLDPLDISRLVAVLDWEMSALGDALVDLGILLTYWHPTAPPDQPAGQMNVTNLQGYFTREEVIERYAARSGRDLSNLTYYETFARFKVAVVIQQIFYRYVHGQTDDQRFAGFGERVSYLAREAAKSVE